VVQLTQALHGMLLAQCQTFSSGQLLGLTLDIIEQPDHRQGLVAALGVALARVVELAAGMRLMPSSA
jgi:hypothetical protein